MIVVSFEKEMREAFAAGEAAAMAGFFLSSKRLKDADTRRFLEATPKTFDEWLESIKDRPAIMRG